MRLLICAGGTGGSVYPALAILKALIRAKQILSRVESPSIGFPETELEILWVGSSGGMEADLVRRENIPFEAIPAAGVHGVGLRALPKNLWQLGRGTARSRAILRRFKPDAMLFTGGYLAVPMAVAARSLFAARPPAALYVPDIEPGLALKTIASFADLITVTTQDSVAYFGRHPRVVVSGYPTRPELEGWTVEAARQTLNLSSDQPVLLVFGGSKGAQSINRAILAVLPELLQEMQIIHISGSGDWPEVEAQRGQLPEELASRYRAFPYLHEEMGAALRAADLVVSRAGASALGEFPLFSLPAILVPYPYAWRYQQVNAQYLARHGAAIVLADAELGARLASVIRNTINDPHKLQSMRSAMQALAKPEAAATISGLVDELGRRRQGAI